MDYQTQQMKLLPAISTAYALIFTGVQLGVTYDEVARSIEAGDQSRVTEVRLFNLHDNVVFVSRCIRCNYHLHGHFSILVDFFS